eukprot:362377-Chlamydomonas_euryale.AAC.6
MVKEPYKVNPNNSVVAFKDNSSCIRGFSVTPMLPVQPGAPSPLKPQPRDWDLLLTAETHNFPCAVAPLPGAEIPRAVAAERTKGRGAAGYVCVCMLLDLQQTRGRMARTLLLQGARLVVGGWVFCVHIIQPAADVGDARPAHCRTAAGRRQLPPPPTAVGACGIEYTAACCCLLRYVDRRVRHKKEAIKRGGFGGAKILAAAWPPAPKSRCAHIGFTAAPHGAPCNPLPQHAIPPGHLLVQARRRAPAAACATRTPPAPGPSWAPAPLATASATCVSTAQCSRTKTSSSSTRPASRRRSRSSSTPPTERE